MELKSLFSGLFIFPLLFSCEVPKSISGDYFCRIDDSLYVIYHFKPDSSYIFEGIGSAYQQRDSGTFYLRNDSIYFCNISDSASEDACGGNRITKRINGTLVIQYYIDMLRPCDPFPKVISYKEKLILKKIKPRD